MQYLGGKSKWGKQIVETIEPWRGPDIPFVDVFCGALNVVRHAAPPRIAVDLCQPLITTLLAVQNGWNPPDHVSEEEYKRIKASPDPWDPLTAFVMFGCSFGGKWGNGYARSKGEKKGDSWAYPAGQSFAGVSKRGLFRRISKDLELFCSDYRQIPDPYPGLIMYCDPPYHGTTTYDAVPPFDSVEFWHHAAWWTRCGAFVFVSEGAGARPPDEWIVFKVWIRAGRLAFGKKDPREERLYVHRDSPMGQCKIKGLV